MLQNLKGVIAAQGYDVVSFFNGSPKKGNEAYDSNYNGAKYLFASLEDKRYLKSHQNLIDHNMAGFAPLQCLKTKK